MNLAARIDRFLFAPVDARVLAGFRAVFACGLVVFFWPNGRPLTDDLAEIRGLETLWDRVFLTWPWWWVSLAAIAAWGAGLGKRWLGMVLLLLLLPLAPLPGSVVSRQILLFSLLALTLLPPRSGGEATGPIWPIRLVQIQLSLTYLVNAVAKSTPEYLSGDVLATLSRIRPNFLVDLSGGALELGPLVLPLWLCAVGTMLTEYALAILWWIPRMRVAAALLGVAFHMSLKLVIAIGGLDWTCMLLYLSFLLPFEARRPDPADAIASPA